MHRTTSFYSFKCCFNFFLRHFPPHPDAVNDPFYTRGKETVQSDLASITVPIITVSLSISSKPLWKKQTTQSRAGKRMRSKLFLRISRLRVDAFPVRDTVGFPFPPSFVPLHLKDPDISAPSPTRLGSFFHGKWSLWSIFLVWGSGDRPQDYPHLTTTTKINKTTSLYANTIQLMCESKWAGQLPPGEN